MSDSVRPHPWDSPGKNTGVGCHFLLQCMKVKSEREVAQSCPTPRPHGLQPTRLLCPWDFPGKSTGVGCHCLLLLASTYPFKSNLPSSRQVCSSSSYSLPSMPNSAHKKASNPGTRHFFPLTIFNTVGLGETTTGETFNELPC